MSESVLLIEPRSDREAIERLADAIGDIACRCWEQLGIDASHRIQRECNIIAEWAHRLSRDSGTERSDG